VLKEYVRDVQMSATELIVAISAFAGMLSFVTTCLGLTKTLMDGGFLKKHFYLVE
jgi:hypothetical protein